MQVHHQFATPGMIAIVAAFLAGCTSMPNPPSAQILRAPFGDVADGISVDIFTLRNSAGMEVKISNYGGIVTSLKVPDRHGKLGDVVLGYDTLAGYLKASPYFGAIIGRYANRIANARFTLEGKEYKLAANNGANALHGGLKGFDKVVWEARIAASPEGPSLELFYTSKDGEEGYPGNLTLQATYTLTADNSLRLEMRAITDKTTVVNLSHHSYFNLAGKGEILNHEIMIPADTFTPINESLIPTGELRAVQGTPFDFRKSTRIGERIEQDDEQLKFGKGYDHNWVINKPMGQAGLVAEVYEPTSGRILQAFSTEPAAQFYTGNFLDGTIAGKMGTVYRSRNGFCIEPQHFPDSPNQPSFPSVVLQPGKVYQNTIIYRFSVRP